MTTITHEALERMLRDCVPGGDIVDPQLVADNIREWFAALRSVAPPALYQHDDGRYALALSDLARHKLTDGDPAWHRVPLAEVVGPLPELLAAQPQPQPNYESMFVAACAALAEVSRELGCEPDQGGAEPIIEAIRQLRQERDERVDDCYAMAGQTAAQPTSSAGGQEPERLTKHGVRALSNSIREVRSLVDHATDLDFDEMTVGALQTAIESMEMRQKVAPVAAEAAPQAVDLGQFREAVVSYKSEATYQIAGNEGYPARQAQWKAQADDADRLLALIGDSQQKGSSDAQ